MRVPEASVCVQMLVDERPSQPRVGGAIMCRARVPRESARFDRARMLEGSSWWSLDWDGPEGRGEGKFKRLCMEKKWKEGEWYK